MTNLIDDEITIPTNSHLSPECNICKFKIDENYKFIKKSFLFSIFSLFAYLLAELIFFPITWIIYGLRVKGRKNLKKIKNAVFISNHVLTLDFLAINTHVLFRKRPYILANHRPFHMPFVRRLVRLLRAVPLPNSATTSRKFIREVDQAVQNGSSLLIFPEGSMWNYYNKVRPFMPGAFRFSAKNNVPIVPIVLTYRKPNWFYKLFGRKKPLITINILDALYPNKYNLNNQKQLEQKLLTESYQIINEFFKANSTYNEYISKPVKSILKNKKSQRK